MNQDQNPQRPQIPPAPQGPGNEPRPSALEEPVRIAVPVGPEDAKPAGWQKWFWIVIAVLSGVYIFIPEPTDAIPFLGWLDEATSAMILTYALERLGLRIPFLSRLLGRKKKK